MARCGYCGQRDIPKIPFNSETGQALETHKPPWANNTYCRGLETYYSRPQGVSLTAPANRSTVVMRDNVIRVRPQGWQNKPATPSTKPTPTSKPLRIRDIA